MTGGGVHGLKDSMVLTDVTHHRIHQGLMFGANFTVLDLADNADLDILVKVAADMAMHMSAFGVSGGDATFFFYEDTVVSADGTPVPAINRNRFSPIVSGAAVFHTPTVTGLGTLLDDHLIIGGVGPTLSTGSQGSLGLEWILKADTNYLFRVTNVSAAIQPAHVQLDWYEPKVLPQV